MKRSLKWQMTIIFVGLVVCMLLIFYVLNNCFLEQYYVYHKKEDFKKICSEIEDSVVDGALKDSVAESELQRVAEKANIAYLILSGEKSNEVNYYAHDGKMLLQKLYSYILDQEDSFTQEVVETADRYTITKAVDPFTNTEYLEMWGQFENGSWFIMRSPIESIRESVDISSKFLIYIAILIILLSVVLISYFSKRLTKPILELTEVSKKMTELDFDAKYSSGGRNEIGTLGVNFNTMSEKLETTISELKNVNYELQQDIEQKEKMEIRRSEFLGNVSHELKTPIALIQGYAEGLKEIVNEDLENREFYCDVIMDEANKMNQMVKNLMALNQVEAGGDETVLERFDITSMIRGVLQSSEIIIRQKNVTVNFRQDTPVNVWGDQFKVEQVVRNYISNALNHVANEMIIEIKIQTSENKARISVFNTGSPIPLEDVERIWEKFYKVDKSHAREYGGNGIGLSIVKAIMESFKQEYGIKNYDNGVEFWFELDIK